MVGKMDKANRYALVSNIFNNILYVRELCHTDGPSKIQTVLPVNPVSQKI